MSQSRIHFGQGLFDFFLERVRGTAARKGITQGGVVYLAGVLTQRARHTIHDLPDTLAELHFEAAKSGGPRAVRCYREIGDRAMWVTSVFPDSLRRRAVGPDYYRAMGSAAYASLADRSPDALAELFLELANRFALASASIREALEDARIEGSDPVTLYREWAMTGCPTALRCLQRMGLDPLKGSGSA
jgi:sirohydrochlorin ferrochelatase